MTLIAAFARMALARPQKIALITEKSQMSYHDLLQLVQVLDLELVTRGLRDGQTVVMASKRPELCLALTLLLSWRGLTVIFGPPEQVTDAGLAYDYVLATEPNPTVPRARQIIIEPTWFGLLGTLKLPDFTTPTGRPLGTFVYRSSGSTGLPKFIRSSEADRVADAPGNAFMGEVDLGSRRMMSTLTFHSGWSMSVVLATLLAGGSVVALDEGAANALPWIDLYHVDTLTASPAMLQLYLQEAGADQYLTGLRDIRLGGAQSGPRLLEEFSRLCSARLHLGYGSAEIGPCFRWIHDNTQPRPSGYLGPLRRPDLELGFFDDDLTPLPTASEGLVGFRPVKGSFQRQYMAEGGDAKTGFINGWFLTGDVLRREGNDYFIVGRAKEVVNYGGNKFALAQVRQVLEASFPGAMLAPVALADADGIERLGVVYSAPRGLSEVELTAAVAPHFKGLKVLRCLRVEKLPLTETGKVDMRRAKDMLTLG
jgi:non-ribosomal peptide synthetase component E (peptide arylation enzyme)